MSNTIYTINTFPDKPAAGKPSHVPKANTRRSPDWKKSLTRKNASIAMLVILVAVIGSYLWINRTPSLTASAQKLAAFEASSKFAALPFQQQQKYYDAFRAAPDADRRSAMEGFTPAQMQIWRTNTQPFNPHAKERDEFAKAFYADHTAAGKHALLVKMMQEMRANAPATRPAGVANAGNANRPAGAGRGGNAPGDMSTPMREMRESIAEVRMENGLPSHR